MDSPASNVNFSLAFGYIPRVFSFRPVWPLVAVLCMSLSACGSDVSTSFPPGLDPVETSTAPAPAATATDPFPDTLSTLKGDSGSSHWAHGTGYIHAPIARVYEAMLDPDVVTNRRRVAEWSTTPNSEPQYPHSFRVRNTVRDIITLQFDMSYRAGTAEGSETAPTVVVSINQKTWGSSLVGGINGSVVARAVNANTTRVELVNRLDSSHVSSTDAEQYLNDFFQSVRARVQGQPLPSYH